MSDHDTKRAGHKRRVGGGGGRGGDDDDDADFFVRSDMYMPLHTKRFDCE